MGFVEDELVRGDVDGVCRKVFSGVCRKVFSGYCCKVEQVELETFPFLHPFLAQLGRLQEKLNRKSSGPIIRAKLAEDSQGAAIAETPGEIYSENDS